MIDTMVVEKRELDNSFSWMSTLGGAYSALGDYIPNFVSITAITCIFFHISFMKLPSQLTLSISTLK